MADPRIAVKVERGMSRHWKEKTDFYRHRDHMTSNFDNLVYKRGQDKLIDSWTYYVAVCGFTFEFVAVQQIRECLAYYERKIHPSSMRQVPASYLQRWYERLPMWLMEEPKRQKVVKALARAVEEFKADETATCQGITDAMDPRDDSN